MTKMYVAAVAKIKQRTNIIPTNKESDMTPDEKIVKYALDLKGIDLDKLMIADSSQILEAFKWLKQNVSGWQANADKQPQEADICHSIMPCFSVGDIITDGVYDAKVIGDSEVIHTTHIRYKHNDVCCKINTLDFSIK